MVRTTISGEAVVAACSKCFLRLLWCCIEGKAILHRHRSSHDAGQWFHWVRDSEVEDVLKTHFRRPRDSDGGDHHPQAVFVWPGGQVT